MKLFQLALAVLFCLLGMATQAAEQLVSSTEERGNFSAGVGVSYLNSRLLNENGTYSSYKGPGANVQFSLRPVTDFELMGQYSIGTTVGEQRESDKISLTETFLGAKVYSTRGLFMGGGSSTCKQSIKTDLGDQTLHQQALSVFMGTDFRMTATWTLSASVWYKTGVITRTENPTLSANSYTDSVTLQLVMLWSPPSLITNYFRK